jgi:competence protein ComEA
MGHVQRFRWAITVGLVLLTIGGCYLLWRPAASEPPPAAAILVYTPTPAPTETPVPTATPPPLIVYVSGAVAQPGVYTLPPDARVADALSAAGGATAEADLAQINLARRIHDEEQIHIPRQGDPTLPAPAPTPAPAVASAGGSPGKVNINTASAAELDTLPGIGPGYAERIIAYREANGPFQHIEDIQNVPGIGPATFARIKGLITTGD